MKVNLRVIIHVAIFVAMEVVLTRLLSINALTIRIGFGFVPIAVCGMLYGPIWAAAAGGMADVIGSAILFPIGAYYPGFTLTAALTGLIYGLFLYKKAPGNWIRLLIPVSINSIVIGLLLSTYFIALFLDTSFFTILPTRVLECVVVIPIYTAVLVLIEKPVHQYLLPKVQS